MRYLTSGRSRFTGSWLELELEAASVEEAILRAERLGLEDIRVNPVPPPGAQADPAPPSPESVPEIQVIPENGAANAAPPHA